MLIGGDSIPEIMSKLIRSVAFQRFGITVFDTARSGCATAPANRIYKLCYNLEEIRSKIIEKDKPDIVLLWDRCDLMNKKIEDKWVIQSWAEEVWQEKFRNLDSHLEMLTKNGAVVVIVLPEKPGRLLVEQCRRDHKQWEQQILIDGYPPHCFMLQHWEYMERWKEYLANRDDPNVTFVDIDDLVCKDGNIPCDDSTFSQQHNRYDGVHYNDRVGRQLLPILFTRVLQRAGFAD